MTAETLLAFLSDADIESMDNSGTVRKDNEPEPLACVLDQAAWFACSAEWVYSQELSSRHEANSIT